MTLFFAPQIERPAERVRFCLLTRPRGDGTRAAVCSRCGTRGCVCGWTIKTSGPAPSLGEFRVAARGPRKQPVSKIRRGATGGRVCRRGVEAKERCAASPAREERSDPNLVIVGATGRRGVTSLRRCVRDRAFLSARGDSALHVGCNAGAGADRSRAVMPYPLCGARSVAGRISLEVTR